VYLIQKAANRPPLLPLRVKYARNNYQPEAGDLLSNNPRLCYTSLHQFTERSSSWHRSTGLPILTKVWHEEGMRGSWCLPTSSTLAELAASRWTRSRTSIQQ
jgi:hypothetical protein